MDEIPRGRITTKFHFTTNGREQTLDMPLRTLFIAPLSGHKKRPELYERTPVRIGSDNFDTVMKSVRPALVLSVPDRIFGQKQNLEVTLEFDSLQSFTPDRLIRSVPLLRELDLCRRAMAGLRHRLDVHKGSIATALRDLLADPARSTALRAYIKALPAPAGVAPKETEQ